MLFVKALAIWLAMVFAAIANGALREHILDVSFGESSALPISGVILSILVTIIIYLTSDLFGRQRKAFYIMLGSFWVGLTLIFEYGFGFFVRGMELGEINQVFNVLSGNLFALVIGVTLLGPLIVARIKGVIR